MIEPSKHGRSSVFFNALNKLIRVILRCKLKRYALLVDANVSIRQALADILLVCFLSNGVKEASDVAEAPGKMECLRPGLIFIDTQLSGEEGLDQCREIKQVYKDSVIVVLNSSNLPESSQQAARNGTEHDISKGDDSSMEGILTLVEEVMDSR
jgi:DNA-binding NarL/FixJ family response regulator